MQTQTLPYGSIRILVAKAEIKVRDGFKYWYLGKQYVGSWCGANPKGCVNFRAGVLDLFTGEYSIRKPLTTVFN